ncbi:hypothetical protein HID58_095450, partial [Brassica napus]
EPILYSFLLSSSRQLEGQQYSRIISVESLSGNEARWVSRMIRTVMWMGSRCGLDDDFGGDDREPLEDFEDNLADDMGDWDGEGSQTPLYDNDKETVVKKASSDKQTIDVPELIDEDVEDAVFDEYMEGRGGGTEYDDKVGRKRKNEKERSSSAVGRRRGISSQAANDEEGVRTMDDDNFIDDTGVDPSERYGGDGGDRSPTHYPQAEEGEDDDEKKKKAERNPAEIALLVENVMAELEVTAEEDAELNRQGKPAINKLKKLSLLTNVLGKKQLQTEFLDHGVLTLLKNWLEPLPDGSLPSITFVIMFLSSPDEELLQNRRLARDLVDKWSRPIFNKSTRFEDMRNLDEDRAPYRRPTSEKPVNKLRQWSPEMATKIWSDFGSEFEGRFVQEHDHETRSNSMDFLIRPQSKIDPDEVRARAKQVSQDQRRVKNKKLQQLKGPKKKRLQATTVSVEGRGMTKYL